MVTLTIETPSLEQIFELLCNIHPRYDGLWTDEGAEKMGERVAAGFKPVITVDEKGVLCDGAIALGGAFEHGRPVEVAVYRCSVTEWKNGVYGNTPTTKLPPGWSAHNVAACKKVP